MTWPATALLSLSDKTGAVEFARALVARGTRILASGGTARHLAEGGVAVESVETLTGFVELLGGRVKTLHPHVHAPILARRDVGSDMESLAERDLPPIDLVAVSLYPFERRAAALPEAEAVEEIDIGGVALLRAAAKNFAHVIVVDSPSRYPEVLEALQSGAASRARRRAWAARTFAGTARYDAAIASDLGARREPADAAMAADSAGGSRVEELPTMYALALERVRSLRYGENPHQRAALYVGIGDGVPPGAWKEGKELSFNNLLDVQAAASLVWRFEGPACVIVKHGQPCGVACASTSAEAYASALSSDELSAFGGVVALNRPLDLATATALATQFVECVVAPDFAAEARAALASRKNLRAVTVAREDALDPGEFDLRPAGRWALLQCDSAEPPPPWRSVTRRAPSDPELKSLAFAWEIAAVARSNAIVIARGTRLIGIGSGQTSRVDAVDLALMKARRSGHDLAGGCLASDGFFPFADNVEHAGEAGITAIVQPGGSVRDADVIAACDRLGIAMMFTDRRTFRH